MGKIMVWLLKKGLYNLRSLHRVVILNLALLASGVLVGAQLHPMLAILTESREVIIALIQLAVIFVAVIIALPDAALRVTRVILAFIPVYCMVPLFWPLSHGWEIDQETVFMVMFLGGIVALDQLLRLAYVPLDRVAWPGRIVTPCSFSVGMDADQTLEALLMAPGNPYNSPTFSRIERKGDLITAEFLGGPTITLKEALDRETRSLIYATTLKLPVTVIETTIYQVTPAPKGARVMIRNVVDQVSARSAIGMWLVQHPADHCRDLADRLNDRPSLSRTARRHRLLRKHLAGVDQATEA